MKSKWEKKGQENLEDFFLIEDKSIRHINEIETRRQIECERDTWAHARTGGRDGKFGSKVGQIGP